MNSAILNVNEALDNGIDKADGFGKALLDNNGRSAPRPAMASSSTSHSRP